MVILTRRRQEVQYTLWILEYDRKYSTYYGDFDKKTTGSTVHTMVILTRRRQEVQEDDRKYILW